MCLLSMIYESLIIGPDDQSSGWNDEVYALNADIDTILWITRHRLRYPLF